MIYTVTFNPSLDYFVNVNNLKSGIVNRATSESLAVGGKGINVSLALRELGNESLALGFLAGFTGSYIREKMIELGLNFHFFEVAGRSRINVKVKSNNETDINGEGANISDSDVDKLVTELNSLLKDGDWLILSGSVPSSLNHTIYADVLDKLKNLKGVYVVVDSHGKLLTDTLKYHPFLIKPNIYELCEIFGLSTVPDTDGIFEYAKQLQEMGASNVIVSLGSAGAAMITQSRQKFYVRAAGGHLVNSVGAGDSMIAGFIHEYLNTGDYFSALHFGTAAGSACAFTKNLATKEQIEYVNRLMI